MLGNNWYKGAWVVENVIPYYQPLIPPAVTMDRHLFWCNFQAQAIDVEKEKPIAFQTGTNGRYGFNLKGVDVKGDKRQILRNLVNPKIGEYFLERALGITSQLNTSQQGLFA